MIPQELSALMALRQGMQQGRVSTTTPAGEPTVAAQEIGAAEQAVMPAVPQAVRQAGLGAQIQAMRMQEAQKAMMNAAMQQQQQPVMAADGGLMRLNPGIQDFAEGGIVGYAAGELVDEEELRRRIAREGVAPLFEMQRSIASQMETAPPTPEQINARAALNQQADEAFLRGRGLDPEYLQKRAEEDKALAEQQRGLLRERMEREQGRDTFLGRMGEALRGFRQMKGQGIGTGILSAEDALSRRVAGAEARMDQLRDLEIKVGELDMTRRRALEDARHAIARGDRVRAQQDLAIAQQAANDKAKLLAPTFGQQATALIEQEKTRGAAADRKLARETREQSGIETLLRHYDQAIPGAVEKIEKVLAAKYPMAVLYNMNPEQAMKTDPNGVKAYLEARKQMLDEAVAPLEERRQSLVDRLGNYGQWGKMTVTPNK